MLINICCFSPANMPFLTGSLAENIEELKSFFFSSTPTSSTGSVPAPRVTIGVSCYPPWSVSQRGKPTKEVLQPPDHPGAMQHPSLMSYRMLCSQVTFGSSLEENDKYQNSNGRILRALTGQLARKEYRKLNLPVKVSSLSSVNFLPNS